MTIKDAEDFLLDKLATLFTKCFTKLPCTKNKEKYHNGTDS